mmetsp:Transcript_30874/g.88793  ORF Transcript_30874/g.88793 Transcript_30874/m.88793 type:complete len:229 (-) Transcript_30874:287-973(-)
MDLDAIRAQLAASRIVDTLQPSAASGAAASEKPAATGPLAPFMWSDVTKVGPPGPLEDVGCFLRDAWKDVCEAPLEKCGLLGGEGMAKDGGPPDRLSELHGLEDQSKGELDVVRVSGLHCAFALVFWAHQQAVDFKPNMNMTAAGQKGSSHSEDLFSLMLKAVNLSQQICRDVRNLAFDQYGCKKQGLKDTSTFARKLSEKLREHSAGLKTHINGVMADSIGLSTGGA